MLTAKTLEGFGGLLRRYCPERCGPFFTELIRKLLLSPSPDDSTSVNVVMNKEKLIALLTNQVGHSDLYNNKMRRFCWQPLDDVDIDQLESIVGRDQLRSIENRQRGNDVLHCYRISTKLNHHGYGNYRPNLHNVFKFISYRRRN